MRSTRLLFYSLAVSFFLSGCNYAMEEIGIFKTGNSKLNTNTMQQFSEETVTFDLLKTTSLKTCLQCHIHKDGSIPLNTPDLAYNIRDSIMTEVSTGEMPPRDKGYPSLTACEKKLLQVWFDAQTNNLAAPRVKEVSECNGSATPEPNTPEPTTPQPTPTPEPTASPSPSPASIDYGSLELSFRNLKSAFFEQKCLRCHSSMAKRTKDPIMDTIEGIKTNTGSSGQANIGASGAESFLYKITVPGMIPGEVMPPPRANLGTLSAEEADYLKRWIDAGMPE
ncbi:MAG: hypothetical protein ACM3MG_11290 [Bacillota bacterium]